MLPIIGIILVVCILILLNIDSPLKNKINVIINMLFIIIVLLALNAYMLYPQYKNSLDIQNTMQEINNSLGNWNR